MKKEREADEKSELLRTTEEEILAEVQSRLMKQEREADGKTNS
jgi:hypothetical protein